LLSPDGIEKKTWLARSVRWKNGKFLQVCANLLSFHSQLLHLCKNDGRRGGWVTNSFQFNGGFEHCRLDFRHQYDLMHHDESSCQKLALAPFLMLLLLKPHWHEGFLMKAERISR
jgi:hypothetical protein